MAYILNAQNLDSNRTGPLAPYRVLDLSSAMALYCGKLLGDLGADVIIVEPPGGHPARALGPFYHDQPDLGCSLFWFTFNTSKRSITLNIETPDGQDLLRRLVASAHFLVESFPVGYLNGLRLGYGQLSAINPSLIMASVTPFGQTGPYAHWQTSELVGQAMGGIQYIVGDAERAPAQLGGLQVHLYGGIEAAEACLIAHHYRQDTGEGQYIDLGLQHGVAAGMGITGPHQSWDLNRVVFPRAGIPYDQGPIFGVAPRHKVVVPCKDGYFAMSHYRCPVAPLVDWMAPDGYQHLKERQWSSDTVDYLTREEREVLDPAVLDFLTTKPKTEIYRESLRRRLPWAPIQTPADLLSHPHLAARGFFVNVEHPELDTSFAYAGAPAALSETPWRLQRRAPLIGEHNNEVYIKEMGLSLRDLARFRAGGVI
ncbi:MAG: CoA transferase [Chloroflexi bacterium]|nr:CoA transferase [Chloroflexota bacterium]